MRKSLREENLKILLKNFFKAKKVNPPITAKKLEKAEYDKTEFLLELRNKLAPYSDMPIIQDYLAACEKLI